MAYKVIKKFKDLKDNDHIYEVNDIYPRKILNLKTYLKKELKN